VNWVQATLVAAGISAFVASLVAGVTRCPPKKRTFRVVSTLIWLSLGIMWMVAATGYNIYIIRSGILTRLLLILQMAVYMGELILERDQCQ